MTDTHNEQLLVSFLLGSLPPGEAERLDELSVSDDAFALELSAAENDLVDAYVRGELSGKTEQQFRAAYLSTPKRREKLNFAETFYSFQQRAGVKTAPQPKLVKQKTIDLAASREDTRNRKKSGWQFFRMPSFGLQWGFAAAAVVLCAATVYLADSNHQLHDQVARTEAERSTLAQQAQQLQRALETPPAPVKATENPSAAKPADRMTVAAFVLLPSLRGVGSLPTVSVPADTDLVVLKLQLEANDFSKYRVSIVDSATRQPVWHSTNLQSMADGEKQAISFAFRKDILKQGNYTARVEGIQGNGDAEPITSYPFRAVLK